MERNLPRNWIVRDDVLAQIAQQYPKDTAGLARIRGMKGSLPRGVWEGAFECASPCLGVRSRVANTLEGCAVAPWTGVCRDFAPGTTQAAVR